MTITTPPQETRVRRTRRSADDAAVPARTVRRRTPPSEAREDTADGAAEARSARSGVTRSGAEADTGRTRAATERRVRKPAAPRKPPPKGRTAAKPARPARTAPAKVREVGTAEAAIKAVTPRRSATPPRAPFVLLVVGLLGGALVSLLLLNTVLAQDAFTLSELQRGNQQLSERKQALQEDINRENSPSVLHSKARGLGMVDGQRPAFIDARTGRVTESGTRPPGVSDETMAAAAAAGVAGAPGTIMPPTGAPRAKAPRTGDTRAGDTGGGTR